MAVAHGLLARPPLSIASILPHSAGLAASRSSASRVGSRTRLSGGFTRLCGVDGGVVGHQRTTFGFCGGLGGSERCACAKGSSQAAKSVGGRRRERDFFSMATAASSQTFPVEESAEYAIQERILAHQKAAAKLSPVEEARTLVYQTGIGTLSTVSKKYDGYPVGSMVTYASDEDGSIILSISSLASHSQNLELNPKCSLLVPKDPTDKSDTIVTIIGLAQTVSDQDVTKVRNTYLKKHPDASWVDFGDFRFVRIRPMGVKYVSGLATGFASVAEFTQEQFKAATIDPISQFTIPIAGHMNRDHADQTAQIVENTVGVKVDTAIIQDVDRFGFGVKAKREGEIMKLRIPFPRPAEDRRAVKTLIVEMLGSKET